MRVNAGDKEDIMESFTFFAPTRLLFGPGKLNELGDQELPGKRALLVTTGGKSVKANGYLARVEAQLDRVGVEHVLFDRIEPNPLRDTVNAGGLDGACGTLRFRARTGRRLRYGRLQGHLRGGGQPRA